MQLTEITVFPHDHFSRDVSLLPKKTALIKGAGPAGLTTAFKLLKAGYDVTIVDRREDIFSRFNIVNINVEADTFLEEFGLLEEFQASVAARIKEHEVFLITKAGARRVEHSKVFGLKHDKSIPFEREHFNKLFTKDGVYSVQIGALQRFLVQQLSKAGVKIITHAETDILERTETGGISTVQIRKIDGVSSPIILKPDRVYIAEGAHSETAELLQMRTKVIENECSNESWAFANLEYNGAETFVTSFFDTTQKTLRIANVIFNAKSHIVNVAVTSDKAGMQEAILEFAQIAFKLKNIEALPKILNMVEEPVTITNKIAVDFSLGNVRRVGDAGGVSSPLAGLGAALCLTLVPDTVGKDLNTQDSEDFDKNSEAYVLRWVDKSVTVKNIGLKCFKAEQAATAQAQAEEQAAAAPPLEEEKTHDD